MSSSAPQWQEVEIELAGPTVARPYLEVDAWATFEHTSGATIRRQVFWDGGSTFRIRFASPLPDGEWTWRVEAADPGHVFTPDTGTVQPMPADVDAPHPGEVHGFATIAPGGRTMAYADGAPAFMVADTAWAMPWRARLEDVETYAEDRQDKGFNAAFLMMLMPDMGVSGPVGRDVDEGFAVAFHDLPSGHLNDPDPAYFREFDAINRTLLDHAITPVLQPVFHGFGWKGQDIAGPVIPPQEYARFCRYLVARYGARPAVYLVCGDGSGLEPTTEAGGRAVHECDAYGQPTGIHYRPHSRNEAHQDEPWLDFQSCQTGHDGDHAPDRLATMWANRPVKAILNGEPTYENSGRLGKATGWWQGNEAWINLCAGATLGVGYGAASLWQWRIHAQEPGHVSFYLAEGAGWREALDFEGSRYVGLVGRILAGIDLSRAEPCWDVCQRARGLLVPGELFISYAEHGGQWTFLDAQGRVPDSYWVIDPLTGAVVDAGTRPGDYGLIPGVDEVPRVLICATETPAIARQ